jgi:predicted nucleotidyltransferase
MNGKTAIWLDKQPKRNTIEAMDVAHPLSFLRSPVDIEVLRALSRTTRPLTGREVERLVAERSHFAVSESLRRLTEHGVVDATEAGRANLYVLNRDHIAADPLLQLINLRGALLERLRNDVTHWPVQPRHMSLFGSSARAEGDTNSDLDILIVRPRDVDEEDPAWRRQLAEFVDRIHSWTGNRASISELSEPELRKLRRERPPIVQELERDSVTLAGDETGVLLK